MDAVKWCFLKGSRQHGPYSQAQLRQSLIDGYIGPKTLVRRHGLDLAEWKVLDKVSAFTWVEEALRQRQEQMMAVPSSVPSPRASVHGIPAHGYPPQAAGVEEETMDSIDPAKLAGPIRRVLARNLDFLFLFLFAPVVTGFLFSGLPNDTGLYWFLVFFIALVLEVVVYSVFKTTLGKWTFGIEVVDPHGKRVGPLDYLKRNLLVWVLGLGLGFIIVALPEGGYQAYRIYNNKPTSWDAWLGLTPQRTKARWAGVAILLVAFVVSVILMPTESKKNTGPLARAAAVSAPDRATAIAEIHKLNEPLPEWVNPQIRLDSVSATSGSRMIYHLTLVHQTADEVNKAAFVHKWYGPLMNNDCRNKVSVGLLKQGWIIEEHYRDKQGQPVAHVKLTSVDCLPIWHPGKYSRLHLEFMRWLRRR